MDANNAIHQRRTRASRACQRAISTQKIAHSTASAKSVRVTSGSRIARILETQMLDAIRSLFASKPRASPAPPDVDPVHLAACALLLEIAYADGEFSAPERKQIEGTRVACIVHRPSSCI